MQRRKILKGLFGLALGEHLLMLRSAWAAGARQAPPGFYKITGSVRINGQPARVGMQVNPGDVVETGGRSEAIYVIGQDAYLQRDDSRVIVAGDRLKSGLRVLTGKLLAVFGRGNKRIETATATIGIRGTGCYIESAPEQVYFCLCYGTADVAPISDENRRQTITTQHHDLPCYLHADGEHLIVPAGMINHSDDELIMLETLVGRLPPFVGIPAYANGRY